jgi:hypothetical protein
VVASPTFGLPEGELAGEGALATFCRILIHSPHKAIGGARNWDYRYTWIRDASFTIYAFLRLGLTQEADQYMKFIEERCNDLVSSTC